MRTFLNHIAGLGGSASPLSRYNQTKMYRRAAIAALFLQTVPQAGPQTRPPDAGSESLILKSASRAVQLDVFVNDPSGRPVHGLQKNDFVVTDNGHRRDIRIFTGEIDTNLTPPPSATNALPPDVYSNRVGIEDSRIVTAIVIDAVSRPEGLQRDSGIFAAHRLGWFGFARVEAVSAIHLMEPGQTIAIYAACPDLRIVQDYTSDPGRLLASLKAFDPPHVPNAAGKKQPVTIDALVPPMLSALRDVAGRMSVAAGRKSIVWISQAYGTELNPSAIRDATDSTVAALNDAGVSLYAVDARFSPTCETPAPFSASPTGIVNLTCSQPPDISDEWMDYLARTTGGRAFSGGNVSGVRVEDPQGKMIWGTHRMESDRGVITDALRFVEDDSRYAYQMGFYVPEAELDGKVHTLSVTVPGKPKFELRYRSGYTASANAAGPPAEQELTHSVPNPKTSGPLHPDEVGIDAKIEMGAGAKNELRVSFAIVAGTITQTADGVIALDATFTQTDEAGKELAAVQETLRAAPPETQSGTISYTRAMKLSKGAALLHIRIRDQATNRAGSVTVPIGKR